MGLNPITIGYEGDAQRARAEALSQELHLPVDNQSNTQLIVTAADRIALKVGSFLPMVADFSSKTWQKRRDAGKEQGLVRACKPVSGMTIIDATAGWGRDAAILASFGAKVLMLERHPIMARLLADALIHQDLHSQRILQLCVLEANALDYLSKLTEADCPDLIYLDPMHPARSKTALVKKDLQALQQLIGPDDDVSQLLNIARKKARRFVVMKWPSHVDPIGCPSRVVDGKTVRFDVYSPLSRD